jgi:hypothetical protein
MKKLLAVAVLGMAVVATAAVSTRPEAPLKISQAEVDARIDARLHAILSELVARRARGE